MKCIVKYDNAWYTITDEFLRTHPGGEEIVRRYHGKDITEVFDSTHTKTATEQLKSFKKVDIDEKDLKPILSDFQKRINPFTTPLPIYPNWRLSFGLNLPHDDDTNPWIICDDKFVEHMKEKNNYLRDIPDVVFQTIPGQEDVGKETLELLIPYLIKHYPNIYRMKNKDEIEIIPLNESIKLSGTEHPLQIAGSLVQEDICIMREIDGKWTLVAASLASVSGWKLSKKLGKSMFDIHIPVPHLNAKLSKNLDRFFTMMEPGLNNIYIRHNTGFEVTTWDKYRADPDDIHPEVPPIDQMHDKLFYRIERQTLIKLEKTESIVFTIKVYLVPFRYILAPNPVERAKLILGHINTMDPLYLKKIPRPDLFKAYIESVASGSRKVAKL